MKKITIAIDGFSSCGKSTMAKDLAREVGYIYIDSGAMYRAVTLYSIENGIFNGDVIDTEKLKEAIRDIRITFRPNPECGSGFIGEFKAGTQQIEEMVRRRFPQAKVLRMDMDTTKKKDAHTKILSAFANEEADVLVGTQMIVKGHDFPNVTLVGVLAADMSLYTDDYRSGERTFQLLTQAAGRAGRGMREGEVVIQTYSPEHYAIKAAAAQDYEAFYEQEIRYRELLGYPPAEELMAVLAAGEDERLLETGCKYLKEYVLRIKGKAPLEVIGPASPGVDKIKDIYRRVIYIKAPEYRTLIRVKDLMEQYIEINSGFAKLRIQFDFNPMNL